MVRKGSCCGVTREGRACRLPPLLGSEYCRWHQPDKAGVKDDLSGDGGPQKSIDSPQPVESASRNESSEDLTPSQPEWVKELKETERELKKSINGIGGFLRNVTASVVGAVALKSYLGREPTQQRPAKARGPRQSWGGTHSS